VTVTGKRNNKNEDFAQHLPWFVKPKFILDGNKKNPRSTKYDNTTLWVPPDELAKLTPIF